MLSREEKIKRAVRTISLLKLNGFLGYEHRAKLGHGLLSGEYSKPAPESGDAEQVPEQKVSLGFYYFQDLEFGGNRSRRCLKTAA